MLLAASRGLRGLQAPPGCRGLHIVLNKKCARPRTPKASNLGRGGNFMGDGQAGLGHPPCRGGAGPAEACLQARGSRGVFKGI